MHLLVHPQVVVRREPLGPLIEVRPDVEPDDAIAGDLVESWMRIEIDRGARRRRAASSCATTLQRVLTDVREAVEDWPKMRAAGAGARRRAGQRADRCRCRTRTSPTRSSCCAGSPTTTSPSSATASTGSIAGRRRGEQVAGGGAGHRPGHPAPRPAGAAGAVVDDPGGVRRGAGEAAADHHQGQLAVHRAPRRPTWTTSASRCSTPAGNVVGERRFLGLFSSAAYLHLACGSCRWSSARWPRSWTAPG